MKNAKNRKNKLFSPEYFWFDFVKLTAAPGILWFRPKKLYESEAAKKKIKGPAILISNHIGTIDPMYLMLVIWYRRHRFICKSELMSSKRGAFWLKKFRCIPIDNGDMSFTAMRQITDVLKNGELVSMFPEGAVHTQSDTPSSFKSGMILMSLQGGAPIIPIYIKPRKHFYERITAVIGEPFSVTEKYGERPKFSQIDEAAKLLHEKEMRLMQICNNYKNKKETDENG